MFRRLAAVALALVVTTGGLCATPPPTHASERDRDSAELARFDAHHPQNREVRFYCTPHYRGARWIGCYHRLGGHQQWQGGRGSPGHTFRLFRQQARAFRRYLAASAYPTCSGPSDCPALVRRAAERYGVDPNAAESVAWCESTMSPTASNGGRYLGLFQQMASAWASRAASRGFSGKPATDPWANASVSMMMVREDGDWGQWECKP